MNQKGFVNIIIVAVVVLLTAVAGYFAFVRKSKPVAEQLTPTLVQPQVNFDSKPFVKIKEDGEDFYYKGRESVSGTYVVGNDIFIFILNPGQEYLFPDLKATYYDNGETVLGFEPSREALNLLNLKTTLPTEDKFGMPCAIKGKATVIISGYIATKVMFPGNYNRATLERVLSKTEEKYLCYEQQEGGGTREIPITPE